MDKKKETEDSLRNKKTKPEQLKINMEEPIVAVKSVSVSPKIEIETTSFEDDESVGGILKKTRMNKKLSLEAISDKLNIKVSQLDAIEKGEIAKLPGMVYALGFTKNYASYLGLNEEEIVTLFKQEHLNIEKKKDFSFPEPIVESGMPAPTLIGIGAFFSILLLLAWVFYSNMDMGKRQFKPAEDGTFIEAQQNAEPVINEGVIASSPQEAVGNSVVENSNETPVSQDAGVAAPTVDAALPVATSTVEETAVSPTQFSEIPPEVKDVSVSPTDANVQPQAVNKEQSGEGQLKELKSITQEVEVKEVDTTKPGEEIKPAQEKKQNIEIKKKPTAVLLKAKEASWIQITDSKQKVIFRKVLRPGDEYAVPDEKGLILVTANAGGLDVFVQGDKVQSIGESGEIVRGISLDPESLKTKRIKTGGRR